MQLFLDYYAASQPPPSKLALESLVRLASVRRSLFSSDVERSKFLNQLVNGCRCGCSGGVCCAISCEHIVAGIPFVLRLCIVIFLMCR